MSSTLLLILNILCLSTLHACNARLVHISAIEIGTTKGVEKVQHSGTFYHSRLQQSNKAKGIEITRHRQKMLESTSYGDTNEAEDVKEKHNNVEDIVVMDYAQPHRKQPIHN